MPTIGGKIAHIRVTEFLAKGGMGDVYAGTTRSSAAGWP